MAWILDGLIPSNGPSSEVFEKLTYDQQSDTIVADASLQVKPSTIYLGSAFGISNAIQAVGFRLADGTDAICLVNRFSEDEGTISNPKFFALGESSMLDINLVDNQVMSEPIEVGYTTVGDNLTYSFEIKPSTAGRLRAQYWLGSSDNGAPVVDFSVEITQEQVDSGQPVLVGSNFYVIAASSQLFVRFSGIDLKGDGVVPYFRSKILPYKEITLNGHTEEMDASTVIFVGCTYIPTASDYTKSIPANFTSDFEIKDLNQVVSNSSRITVDFGAQGSVILKHSGDHVKFHYIKGDGWYFEDIKGLSGGRV